MVLGGQPPGRVGSRRFSLGPRQAALVLSTVRRSVYRVDNMSGVLDGYIAGYVDGEGSFSVSVQRNPTCRVGFQLVPEFHGSQNGERAEGVDLTRSGSDEG